MPTLVPSQFCRYYLTEYENLEGQLLSFAQKCVIQNLIADIAKEKLELTITPTDYQAYWSREAELQGQLGILQMMLDSSDTAAISLQSYQPSNRNQAASSGPFSDATHFPPEPPEDLPPLSDSYNSSF